jgi:hypothetical protein
MHEVAFTQLTQPRHLFVSKELNWETGENLGGTGCTLTWYFFGICDHLAV